MKNVISIILIALLFSCKYSAGVNHSGSEIANDSAIIKKGKYLVTVLGCNDCHSPKIFTVNGPVIDSNLLLSGYPSGLPMNGYDSLTAKKWLLFDFSGSLAKGPWGISFAANITPDSTGIGSWTELQFSNALRNGDAKGLKNGRKLLPPMPWRNYTVMTDADVKAIFYYLKSINPIHNLVPAPISR